MHVTSPVGGPPPIPGDDDLASRSLVMKKNSLSKCLCVAIAAMGLVGCSDDVQLLSSEAATASGTGGAGSTAGPGGAGGSGAQGGGAGGGAGSGAGGGSYMPPPVVAACATPTITPAAQWMAAAGQHFASLRAT